MRTECAHRGWIAAWAATVALAAAAVPVAAAVPLPPWLDLGGPASRLAPGAVRDGAADVSALLASAMGDVPGIVGAVVRGDRVIARGAAGVRVAGSAVPVTVDDRLHLGSCTKAMTATLCALLVQEGKLSWSATLPGVMPELAGTMDPAWRGVTLEQLLTHRSGVVANPPPTIMLKLMSLGGDVAAGRAGVLKWATERAPARGPGSFEYSNVGYMLAGVMAERVTGERWEELMRRRLFEPLGMSSAGFGAPGTGTDPAAPDNAWGHRGRGAGRAGSAPGPMSDNPPSLGPAGTVHASVDDWARFAVLHLKAARGERAPAGWPVLSAESVGRLHAPAPGPERYAMGWEVRRETPRTGGRPALWHNGSNTLWYCELLILPGRDEAVLVACNAGDRSATRSVQAAAEALAGWARAQGQP